MSEVIRFPLRNCVEINQGTATDGVYKGRLIFIVDYYDDEGGVLTDYVGDDYAKAQDAANMWAQDTGGRLIDHVEAAGRAM